MPGDLPGAKIAENIVLHYNEGKIPVRKWVNGSRQKIPRQAEEAEQEMRKKYVCIDIGGTAIKYGLLSGKGEILSRGERKTESYKGGPSILKKAEEITEAFCREEEISGICISTAGMVDTAKGEISHAAPLIPNYTGINFKKTLEEKFRIPCEVENDVNCAGLAEYVSGAAAGSSLSLMLTIGTGIGGSLILDGKVFHGFSGSACEVGYMHMLGSDFQTLGAARILTRKVAEWKNEREEIWNGYHIFEEAKKGDELCNRAIDEMCDVLGLGIANICYVINPEIVVLGGGVMAQEEFLKNKIESAVHRYLIPNIASNTRIVFAKHRNDAGMLGAFYHFCQCRGIE